MRYPNVSEGIFLSRPNRFIAQVRVNDREETVHVKNTGRCRELLIPGCRVYLSRSDGANRKTAYDLIAVEKLREGLPPLLINMDSQAPNHAAFEWLPESRLFSPGAVVKREVTYHNSRFDLYIEDGERKAFMEIKGVTLEQDGAALFPDAPTLRGIKHLEELGDCLSDGLEAYVLFLVQMKGVRGFAPNAQCHREFAEALVRARGRGVRVLSYDCLVEADSIRVDAPVPLLF